MNGGMGENMEISAGKEYLAKIRDEVSKVRVILKKPNKEQYICDVYLGGEIQGMEDIPHSDFLSEPLDIQQFESRKVETLIKYGFPYNQLWLTECELNDNNLGVVYYHESSEILAIGWFHDDESFEQACRTVAGYFNSESTKNDTTNNNSKDGVTNVANQISATVSYKFDNEFINDVLCTALDSAYGGSLYWLDRTFIRNGTKESYGVDCKYEVVSLGGTLAVIADEDDTEHDLDKESFIRGLEIWVANRDTVMEELDAGDIDANDADAILQYALFGELVYC